MIYINENKYIINAYVTGMLLIITISFSFSFIRSFVLSFFYWSLSYTLLYPLSHLFLNISFDYA